MNEKISVDEALDRIDRNIRWSAPLRIAVDAEAEGHILAAAVDAAADTPRFDASAMDGFALASGETRAATPTHPVRLALADDIPAAATPAPLLPHSAAPISTGAAIPVGADAVVAKERSELVGGMLQIREPVAASRNIRRRGEDARAGTPIAAPGSLLSPELIGALLAYGVTHVEARRPPSVQILVTGSELTEAATDGVSARRDSNGPMIGAMCRSLGLRYRLSHPIRDEAPELCRQILSQEDDPSADLIISTGGVSVGAHDMVRTALDMIGARIIFHGIAMRPGKPLLFAILPDGRPFFGLPGNPVAALVGLRFFVLAAIRKSLGLPREAGIDAALPACARDGVTLFLRARRDPSSPADVTLLDDQRSHVLGSMVAANCWVRVEASSGGAGAWVFDQAPRLAP